MKKFISSDIKFCALIIGAVFLLLNFLIYNKLQSVHEISNTFRELEIDKYFMLFNAYDLEQSSDDLTRYARQYVVTADVKYKEKFIETLAIRNGEKARKINEGYASMHRILNGYALDRFYLPGAKISLKETISQLPYSKQELQKLDESEYESNQLAKLEMQAFEAMRGFYEDNSGDERTIQGNLGPSEAKSFLFSSQYEKHKEKIMNPIREFHGLLNERLAYESQQVQTSLHQGFQSLSMLFIVSAALFLILVAVFFYYLHKNYLAINALAQTDPLTNIHNRRSFNMIAEKVLSLAKRYESNLSLLMVDIDHFKKINDKHGHVIGDEVLKYFANTTQNCYEIVIRFVVIVVKSLLYYCQMSQMTKP